MKLVSKGCICNNNSSSKIVVALVAQDV